MESIAVIQVEIGGTLDLGGGSEGSEKRTYPDYILKVDLRGFPKALDMKCERKSDASV